MPKKKVIRALLIATGLLIVPLTASFFVDGWLWTTFDYVFAWVVFSLVSLGLTLVATGANGFAYKAAGTIAVLTAFLLIWINAAVGIIGDGDLLDSPNGLYVAVILGAIMAAVRTRLDSRRMSRVLYGTAMALALIPLISYLIWPPSVISWSPGVLPVFVLNGFFVLSFVISGLLFRRASVTN
jgi:hypothetical protein